MVRDKLKERRRLKRGMTKVIKLATESDQSRYWGVKGPPVIAQFQATIKC